MNHGHLNPPSPVTGEYSNVQQRSPPTITTATATTSDPWETVQELNNRGCVHVTLGNYLEANRLFESALFRHKTVAGSMETSHNDNRPHLDCNSNSRNLEYEYGYDEEDEYEDEYEEDDISLDSNDSDVYRNEDYDDFMMMTEEEYNDCGGSLFSSPSSSQQQQQQQQQVLVPVIETQSLQGFAPIGSTSSVSKMHYQNRRIRRMTSSSLLPTFSFCGQDQCHRQRQCQRQCQCHHNKHDHANKQGHRHHHHHEIYCLPIVMDEAEWMLASVEDKTFVLIFNTAVCNHLWGMHGQQQQQQQQQEKPRMSVQSERAYLVADKLYRLALDNAVGIDYRLCIVAILNNLSHVSKTLDGPHSREGFKLDRSLLRAIFWLRDSKTQQQRHGYYGGGPPAAAAFPAQQQQQQQQQQLLLLPGQQQNDIYEEDDDEIIDLFLDNVFYLIGAPEQSAPAAAA
eukprot:jgi/Psemu1/22809/gm1.22809_g